jgi:8-oxo-dGTP pyrophosphatase MutT (NUDIX family)
LVADAPDARPAAVALVLLEGPDGLEILLIRRAERADDPWSGQIAFPGGRYDVGDRDLEATAIRETREETGVDLSRAEPLGALDDLYPRTSLLPPVVVRPFVFALTRRAALFPSDEVQRAFWLPLGRLSEPGVRRDVTVTVRDGARTLPAYLVDDDMIWGMTERILTPFVDLVARL